MKEIMQDDNVMESFGTSILMFFFLPLFGQHLNMPKELINEVQKSMNENGNIKEEDIEKLKPLILDYYNKLKNE